MHFTKQVLKACFRAFGLDVRLARNIPPTPEHLYAREFVTLLGNFNIDMVLDVGANTGQFASGIRQCGFADKIISFEPLSEAHAELTKSCAADSLWEAHDRCAIGNHEGQVEINVAGNSLSSSILPMLDAHVKSAPYSAYQGKEMAPITTLDSVAKLYLRNATAPFLKIDTQGYEWHVLDGARETLPHIMGVLVELSLVRLYDGQPLWRDVIDRLESAGFVLWAFQPVFSDPESGRTLQIDGIFFRTS